MSISHITSVAICNSHPQQYTVYLYTQYTAQTVHFTFSELCIVIHTCESDQLDAPLSH